LPPVSGNGAAFVIQYATSPSLLGGSQLGEKSVNKKLVLAALIAGLLAQPAVLAGDWFDKYDHNHDHSWDWNEYYKARRDWEREHREKALSEEELRAEYERYDLDHNHRMGREEARGVGRW